MQKTAGGTRVDEARSVYRERLSPSLWTIIAAAMIAPMAALVFMPLDKTVSLVVGVAVAVAVVGLLLAASPVVEVRAGELRAGTAHIDVGLLGTSVAYTGDDAREMRGPGLDARAWHLIRGGIDGLLRVSLRDPDDPAVEWVVSSRTPDRLAAAIERAKIERAGIDPTRSTPRTPGR